MSIDVLAVKRRLRYIAYDLQPKIQFKIVDDAPEDYISLVNAVSNEDYPILGKYSLDTIYGDEFANIAQRLFHDTIHIRLNADTSKDGEERVAREQSRIVETRFGTFTADVVYADLYGQTLHNVKFNRFPSKQDDFTIDYLITGKVNQW